MLPRLGAHTCHCIKMSVRTTYNRLVWFYMHFYLTLMHIAPVAIAIMLCAHVLLPCFAIALFCQLVKT